MAQAITRSSYDYQRPRRRGAGGAFGAKFLFLSAIYALSFVYIVYHTFNGDRGLYALLKENRKLVVIGEELDKVRVQRTNLEHDAKLLRSESLDLDMLDEQVRSNLGVAGPDEVLVLNGKAR